MSLDPIFWSVFGIGLLLWLRRARKAAQQRSVDIDAKMLSRPDLLEVTLTPFEKANMVGSKLASIKSVRDRTGLDLSDAYAVVDYWSRHPNDERTTA